MLEISGSFMSPCTDGDVTEVTYRMPVSTSTDPPGQFAPPSDPGSTSVPRVPLGSSRSMTEGGV